MTFAPLPPPLQPMSPVARSRPPLSAIFAWCVVGLICGGLVSLSVVNSFIRPATVEQANGDEAVDVQTRVAGQYAVALKSVSPAQAEAALMAMPDTPRTPVESRIAAAIVAGEVNGNDDARKRLAAIGGADAHAFARHYVTATSQPASTQSALPSTAPGGSVVPPTSTDAGFPQSGAEVEALLGNELKRSIRYGWFARLAETHGQADTNAARAAVLEEGHRTLRFVVGGFSALGLVGVIGVGLLVTAIVLLATGRLRFITQRPIGASHVYIEAFAIYLGGFILVSLLLQLIGPTPLGVHVLAQGVFVVLAVVWPRLRGVPWASMRHDWGIHTGRGVIVEAFWGVVGYVAGLPIVAVGLMITLGLVALTHVNVAHPISREGNLSPWILLGIASVFAPLTEELLFRGALVSHLRGTWGVVMSALISGTIFASVHPQGWAAIPALASIGAVFALVRQWRGSLVPSITAHALNNGVLVGMLILLSN